MIGLSLDCNALAFGDHFIQIEDEIGDHGPGGEFGGIDFRVGLGLAVGDGFEGLFRVGFEVGEGVDGRWPLCGPVRDQLGSEAVASWRAVRDNEQWLEDVAAARMSHEQMLVRLKEREKEERQKRQEAKR